MQLEPDAYRVYDHVPPHLHLPGHTYMLTASTLYHQPFFDTPEKLHHLLATIMLEARRFGWQLFAWAVMLHHYHLIAPAPEDKTNMSDLFCTIHSQTAFRLNRMDGQTGRQVWWNYWDHCIVTDQEYWGRLNYVLNNPVKHHLAANAYTYPWCSMRDFVESADAELRKTVMRLKTAELDERDRF